MKLCLGQYYSKMRYWHIMLIYVIAVLLRCEGIVNITHCKLMMKETIMYGMNCSCNFLTANDFRIEAM